MVVRLTGERNRETYGKRNNPYGHGHNYEVEITVRGAVDPVTGRVVDLALLDLLAEEQILAPICYRNLNEQVAVFQTTVPPTQNLGLQLEKVRIWETDRNICEIAK